jgi:cobalt-zinc-cadmium efflux system outer membrane protein
LEHASRLLPSNPELSVEAGTETEKATGEDADTLGLRISQELWIAGQGGLREEAARQRRRASRSELAYLKASLAARVRAAWLQTRVAGEEQRTAERLLTLTRKNRSIAQQRLDAGAAQAMDVSAATVAMGRAKAARARAESRVQQARLRLARLLSIRADQLPRLSGELEPIELALPDDDTLVRRAARRRADLEAASRRLEAARADLRLSRREVIPNLKVFGFTREIDGREEESGVGIGVELPLFHRRSGENEAARARVDQAQSRRDALLLEVRAAVREGLAAYRGARQRVSALDEEGLDSARRNVELVREAYAAGKVGSEALVTSQRQLFDVREDYLDALRDLVAAATDIERATGGLVTVSPPSSGSATDSKSNTEN